MRDMAHCRERTACGTTRWYFWVVTQRPLLHRFLFLPCSSLPFSLLRHQSQIMSITCHFYISLLYRRAPNPRYICRALLLDVHQTKQSRQDWNIENLVHWYHSNPLKARASTLVKRHVQYWHALVMTRLAYARNKSTQHSGCCQQAHMWYDKHAANHTHSGRSKSRV